MIATTVPTHTDIEAARRAWLATAGATGGHLDTHHAGRRQQDCWLCDWLADDEERAFQELERTKGGHRGDL